jgi:hypothetical protein
MIEHVPPPRLRYLDCRIEVIALDPLFSGQFLTNTLRGGLGYRLKALVCSEDHGECHRCEQRLVCCYPDVFEPGLVMGEDRLGSMPAPPAPYVLRLDMLPGRIPAGAKLRFTLRVFGRTVRHVPQLVAALADLGRQGLGIRQSRFRLDRVFGAISPFPVFQEMNPAATPIGGPILDLAPAAEVPGNAGVRMIRVDFTMPVRLKTGNRIARDLSFGLLVERVSRRLHLLQRFYDPPVTVAVVRAESVTGVRCVDRNLRWHDLERYSTRQQSVIPLGGLVGSATFEGDLGPYLPLLRAGQVIHVGTGAAFGLGRYDLAVL